MHALSKLAGILIALVLLAGAGGVAVRALDDRELMVSPPDAVAEGFVREVVMKRWTRAEPYLQQPVPENELRALEQSIAARVGDPVEFEAKIVTRTKDDARVRVRLASGKGSYTISFALVFDDEWKIVTP